MGGEQPWARRSVLRGAGVHRQLQVPLPEGGSMWWRDSRMGWGCLKVGCHARSVQTILPGRVGAHSRGCVCSRPYRKHSARATRARATRVLVPHVCSCHACTCHACSCHACLRPAAPTHPGSSCIWTQWSASDVHSQAAASPFGTQRHPHTLLSTRCRHSQKHNLCTAHAQSLT